MECAERRKSLCARKKHRDESLSLVRSLTLRFSWELHLMKKRCFSELSTQVVTPTCAKIYIFFFHRWNYIFPIVNYTSIRLNWRYIARVAIEFPAATRAHKRIMYRRARVYTSIVWRRERERDRENRRRVSARNKSICTGARAHGRPPEKGRTICTQERLGLSAESRLITAKLIRSYAWLSTSFVTLYYISIGSRGWVLLRFKVNDFSMIYDIGASKTKF